MSHTFNVTQSPSFPVISGTYERFFPTKKCRGRRQGYCVETTYFQNTVGYLVEFCAPHVALPTEPPAADWLKFQRLVADWQRERGAMSSITEMALCPPYQEIIGMGKPAIKFILAQLQTEGDEPDQWFWALRALTGTDPMNDEERGDFVKMSRSWLDWAKKEGYAR